MLETDRRVARSNPKRLQPQDSKRAQLSSAGHCLFAPLSPREQALASTLEFYFERLSMLTRNFLSEDYDSWRPYN